MELKELYQEYLQAKGVSTDSRNVPEGSLFFALKGPNFNGNRFAADALAKGARLAVIDEADETTHGRPGYVLVEDVLQTLQDLARYHREQLDIPVIAIAGSNGKTTTKELTHRVLTQQFKAFATPGNLNNHIGIALTLLQLQQEHEMAVIELGANHKGENRDLCHIARPSYGLVTNVGKDHLEGFGGVEGVIEANKELYDYLSFSGGVAFVNAGDETLVRMASGVEQVNYAAEPAPAGMLVRGKVLERFPFLKVRLTVKKVEVDVETHLFGHYQLYNILAAACVGAKFGIEAKAIATAIRSYRPRNNRSQLIEWGSNTIILDAYNANPSSVHPSIDDFADYPAPKKIIILGDMHELGEESEAEHRQVVEHLQQKQWQQVVLVGKEFARVRGELSCLHFPDVVVLKEWLHGQHFESTTFFIKGSRGQALEKAVEGLADQ